MPEVLAAWVQLGLAGGMLVTLAVALTKGWLWTGPSVAKVTEQQEARLADRDETIKELKEANVLLRKTNDTLATTVKESLEIGRTSNAALTSLPRVGVEK